VTTSLTRKLGAMKSEYDLEIAKAEENIDALKPQMSDALTAWLDATAPWVAERWEETLETAIAYNPDAVKALGDANRKALKERTTAMIDTVRPYLEQRLVQEHPEAWPHIRDSGLAWDASETFITKADRVGSKISQTIPEGVSSMLGGVLSEMADLLEQEGFNLARFLPGSALSRSQKPRVAAGPSLAWSEAMMRTMDAYGRLTDRYSAALDAREKIQAQKDRSEAEELWGNA
jgi:hypothetical protein